MNKTHIFHLNATQRGAIHAEQTAKTWAVSSAVEHLLDTQGVTGSIPVPPTIFFFNIIDYTFTITNHINDYGSWMSNMYFIKKLKILTVAILIFGAFTLTAYSSAAAPKLYNFTCEKYWDYTKTQKSSSNMDDFIKQNIKLWNYSIKKFNATYPKLTLPDYYTPTTAQKAEENPYFIMSIGVLCPKNRGREQDILGQIFQENLYKAAFNKHRKSVAQKDGCLIVEGFRASLFSKDNTHILNACIERPQNLNTSLRAKIIKDESKNPIAIEVCPPEQECIIIPPTDENICLSSFSLCARNEEDTCTWQPNAQYLACLNK